jgi:hypothetical protein
LHSQVPQSGQLVIEFPAASRVSYSLDAGRRNPAVVALAAAAARRRYLSHQSGGRHPSMACQQDGERALVLITEHIEDFKYAPSGEQLLDLAQALIATEREIEDILRQDRDQAPRLRRGSRAGG